MQQLSISTRQTFREASVSFLFIGAEVEKAGAGATEFRYPSYVQHIMG